MRRYGRTLWLPVLLVAGALALASCGGSGASGGSGSGDSGGGMEGMGQGGDGGRGEGQAKKQDGGGMAGMDHGSTGTGSGAAAEELVQVDGEYSDEAFIDAMVPHHRGAIEMAEVALENAEHEEARALAEDIVSAQEAEIEDLRAIKREEFGTAEVPAGMDAAQMEAMGMTDPRELAGKEPFDKAVIDAMIPHHESAIAMAGVALEESRNPEIRGISRDIVEAQEREISEMRSWRQEWYPEG